MVIGLSMLVVAAALAWKATRGKATLVAGSPAEVEVGESTVLARSPVDDRAEPQEVVRPEQAGVPKLPAILQVAPPPAPPAQPAEAVEPRTVATPYTVQLLSGLTNLDLTQNPIPPEQAERWKNTLQSLTGQGAAAVPAIRDLLERNWEMNFVGVAGGELLGQTSLRSALLNALGQIGGPEALSVMVHTLRTTTVPSEVGQLAQALEQAAPGQYRQDILNTASQLLNMAGNGQLPAGWDMAGLFKVFQLYGDGSTASLLEQLQPQWKYYTTLSLAGLPGGEGVPALIRLAEDPAAGASRDFALQMLAQLAVQYTDAGAALMQPARLNQIPDRAWVKIAAGLAGEQYQLGTPPADPSSGSETTPGLKRFHIENRNQNFYSLPLAAGADAGQRLALLEQLIAATGNPVAVTALQNARLGLAGLSAK